MSHSAPSDSSTIEPPFVVGQDLVTFDRSGLAIYATSDTLWADAGREAVFFGGPLDRLFGEPAPVFVNAAALPIDQTVATPAFAEDPLVELAGLADGVVLPTPDLALDDAAHMALTAHEAGADTSLVLAPHDPWSWELGQNDWAIDSHG
jgi:hypothetical protein